MNRTPAAYASAGRNIDDYAYVEDDSDIVAAEAEKSLIWAHRLDHCPDDRQLPQVATLLQRITEIPQIRIRSRASELRPQDSSQYRESAPFPDALIRCLWCGVGVNGTALNMGYRHTCR